MRVVWDMTRPDVQEAITWVIANSVALDMEGEVGFGRECVGIVKNGRYIDYDRNHDAVPPEVTNAYHKHNCTAILGRGADVESELLEWVLHLARNGWKVKTELRDNKNVVEALVNGVTRNFLVKE